MAALGCPKAGAKPRLNFEFTGGGSKNHVVISSGFRMACIYAHTHEHQSCVGNGTITMLLMCDGCAVIGILDEMASQ